MTMDHRYTMPVQLLAQCQVLSLSRVAPTAQFQKQKILLPQLSSQSNEVPKYLYTLLAVVSCIPQYLLEELDKVLPQKKRKLIFLLCTFHAHCYCSFFPAAQLHNLVYALSQLSKDESDIGVLLQSMRDLLLNLYFSSPSSSDRDIISVYVNGSLLEDNSSNVLEVSQDLLLPMPSASASPSSYPDHIIGVINAMKDIPKIK